MRERKGSRKEDREVREGVRQGAWEIVKKGGSCHNHTYKERKIILTK